MPRWLSDRCVDRRVRAFLLDGVSPRQSISRSVAVIGHEKYEEIWLLISKTAPRPWGQASVAMLILSGR